MMPQDYTEIESYSVHPAAEVYPMLPDSRLNELAESIKQDGMHFPIVFTTDEHGEPMLVDGRNRMAAAGIAGVHPKIEWREFDDDDAIRRFVYAASERRDISAGQRAMSAALIWPKKKHGGKRDKASSSLELDGISKARLSEAYLINAHLPDLVDSVMDGTTPFSSAYKAAMEVKRVKEHAPAKAQAIADALPALREHSDELAEKVQMGLVEPEAAEAQMKAEKEQARINRTCQSNSLKKAQGLFEGLYVSNRNGDYVELLTKHRKEFEQETGMEVSQCLELLEQLADVINQFLRDKDEIIDYRPDS